MSDFIILIVVLYFIASLITAIIFDKKNIKGSNALAWLVVATPLNILYIIYLILKGFYRGFSKKAFRSWIEEIK